jgi:hypothetical protein
MFISGGLSPAKYNLILGVDNMIVRHNMLWNFLMNKYYVEYNGKKYAIFDVDEECKIKIELSINIWTNKVVRVYLNSIFIGKYVFNKYEDTLCFTVLPNLNYHEMFADIRLSIADIRDLKSLVIKA